MRWITRRNIHVDRTSCPWLIRKFIDPQAEFVFVEPNVDPSTLNGHTFDMRGAEYSHEGDKCTFQVIVDRHNLGHDPVLVEMGRIIRDEHRVMAEVVAIDDDLKRAFVAL